MRQLTRDERVKLIESIKLWIQQDSFCPLSLAYEHSNIKKEEIYPLEDLVIAYTMRKTGEFEFEIINIAHHSEYIITVNPSFTKKTWFDKNPALWDVIKHIMTLVLSIIFSLLFN